jgi:phosphotransacetylase
MMLDEAVSRGATLVPGKACHDVARSDADEAFTVEGFNDFAVNRRAGLPNRQVMLVDTHVNYDPTAEQLAEITVMAAEEMMRFGLQPKAALLS